MSIFGFSFIIRKFNAMQWMQSREVCRKVAVI